ncbi:MAG: hypothetical protein KDK08_20475, partial [Rhizobiaceae bacterium]|nr:hypothetical protein [Rhizobiaceae bacterium]
LGGWLAVCAVGVSYRLLPMFLLSPDPDHRRIRLVLLSACVATVIAVAGGFAAAYAGRPVREVMAVAALAAGATIILYGRDVVRFYHARRRIEMELNTRIAIPAFASLGLAVLMVAPVAAFAGIETAVASSVYLIAFGWLTGLGLAQLYKIVPFMTWLECYGPVLGRAPTPRVQDLVSERRAQPWFVLYFVSVWTGAAALALGSELVFRAAAVGALAATVAVAIEAARARLLSDVDPGNRFPAGTQRPHFFISVASVGN